MRGWIARFTEGDEASFLAELRDADLGVGGGADRTEATELASRAVDAIARRLEALVDRLDLLGYAFSAPRKDRSAALQWATDTDRKHLRRLEWESGPFPVTVSAWYSKVRTVDLRGYCPGLCWDWELEAEMAREERRKAARLAEVPDPLVIAPIVVAFLDAGGQDEALLPDDVREVENGEAEGARLAITVDRAMKAGLSGAEAGRIALPNGSFDARLSDLPERPWFLDYLTDAVGSGGFPGWRGRPDAPPVLRELARLGGQARAPGGGQ